jgi:hypothetical protein
MTSNSQKDTGIFQNVVINELLCYVQHYSNSASFESLKKVIIDFYSPDEINTAKKLVWRSCEAFLPAYEKRVKSSMRSAHEAEVYDILNAFKKLDCSDSDIPQYAAGDLDRLPKHGPEEFDLVSVLDRLLALEHNQKICEKRMCRNTDSIETLFSMYGANHSYAAKAKSPKNTETSNQCEVLSDTPVYSELKERPHDTVMPPPGLPQRINSPRVKGNTTQVVPVEDKKKKEDVAAEVTEAKNNVSAEESEGYQLPAYHRKKERRRQNAVYGSATDTHGLKGASRSTELFVFRLEKSTTEEQVVNYIKKKNINSVSNIDCVSHVDSTYKSFKLTVNFNDVDAFMEPSFWPQNVGCRYYRKRFKPGNLQHGFSTNTLNGDGSSY